MLPWDPKGHLKCMQLYFFLHQHVLCGQKLFKDPNKPVELKNAAEVIGLAWNGIGFWDYPFKVASVAASAAASTDENPLAYLRNNEYFQQMKHLLRLDPRQLRGLLQQIGHINPELLNVIIRNRDAFISIMNEPVEGSSAGI